MVEVRMSERVNVDSPPFSRVFVVCSKSHREEDINATFAKYGCVEDVWMVKDRMTKENKGICYIKFDRASAAALAIENLDGKVIGDEPKPIKVCIIMYVHIYTVPIRDVVIWVGQLVNCPSLAVLIAMKSTKVQNPQRFCQFDIMRMI